MSYNFPWVPSYGSAATTKPTVQKIKFGDGYEQRVATGINSTPRSWSVTFASRTNDTADALEAFFIARGAVQSFDWTPPHGAAGKWVAREWTVQQTGPFTRTVQATFDEVFA